MNSKRIGGILLVVSLALLAIFIAVSQTLVQEGEELGCFDNQNCQPIQNSLSLVNVGFGFFGFILALGFYLMFLSKGDEAILSRLERDSEKKLIDEKFAILMMGLDNFEKEVISEVRKQDGITQNTLRLRVNMSKAKLSQVLSSLEKKDLVKREQQKKTLAIYLAVKL